MDPDSCEDICFCCFNKAKNLVKLINCKHRSFFDHVVVNDIKLLNLTICSSCHVFLVKIESFKQQIVINLEILADPFQVIDTNIIPKRLALSNTVTTSFSPAAALPIITSVKSCNVQVNDKEVVDKPQPAGPESSPLLRLFSGNGHSSPHCSSSSSPNMFPKTGQLVLIANGQNQGNNKANAITNPGLFTINTSNANTLFSNNSQLLRVSAGQSQVNNKVNAVANPGLFTINTPANLITNTGQLLRVSGNVRNQVDTANAINPVQLTYPIQIKNNQSTMHSGHGESQSDAGNKKPIYILTSPGKLLPVTDGVQPSSNQTQRPTYDQKKGLTDKNLVLEISDSDRETESDEGNNWDDMASLTKAVKVEEEGNDCQPRPNTTDCQQQPHDDDQVSLVPLESWHAIEIHNRYFGKIRAEILTEEGVQEERARMRESEEYQRLPYKCENCVISYEYKYELADHIEQGHKPKPGAPTCGICKLVLNNTDVLEFHTRSHVKRFDCTVCEKRFNSLKLAVMHYDEEHSAEYGGDRQCPDCSYSTRSRSEYLKHKDSHFQYGCEECPEKFDTEGRRQAHLLSVHKKGKFVCKECQKVYNTENGLQIHRLSFHAKDEPESSYCAPCRKQFTNKYYLRTHLRTHEAHVDVNFRRFECHDCGQRFLRKCEMKRHIMFQHFNVGRFKCQHCGKACFTRNLLNRHIRSVHEKMLPSKDKICQYCSRGFPTKAQLTTHTRTHTGERPLQCDLCPATFAHGAARYNHRRIVHKVPKPAAK